VKYSLQLEDIAGLTHNQTLTLAISLAEQELKLLEDFQTSISPDNLAAAIDIANSAIEKPSPAENKAIELKELLSTLTIDEDSLLSDRMVVTASECLIDIVLSSPKSEFYLLTLSDCLLELVNSASDTGLDSNDVVKRLRQVVSKVKTISDVDALQFVKSQKLLP
jgi:hypothetical protein